MQVDNSKFYIVQERFLQTREKADWDYMFQEVYKCCISRAKKNVSGIKVQDLEGKALTAACDVMEHFLKDSSYRIEKLENVVYFPVLKAMCKPEEKFADRLISVDGYVDVHGEKGINGNFFHDYWQTVHKPYVKPPTGAEKDFIFNKKVYVQQEFDFEFDDEKKE